MAHVKCNQKVISTSGTPGGEGGMQLCIESWGSRLVEGRRFINGIWCVSCLNNRSL